MSFRIQARDVAALSSWISSLESYHIGTLSIRMKKDLDSLTRQDFLTQKVAYRAFNDFLYRWIGLLTRQQISVAPIIAAIDRCFPGSTNVSLKRAQPITSRPFSADQIYRDPEFRDQR